MRKRTGDQKQEFELAEAAAVARVTGLLYNLPDAIKQAAEALEQRKQHLDKMKQQDGQQIGRATGHLQSVGEPVSTRSYADKLAEEAVAAVGRKEE